MNRKEYDAAEALMMEFGDSNRVSALIDLGVRIHSENPEKNSARAIGVLQRVRSFLPERPSTSQELGQTMELVVAMSNIDAKEAFRTLEPTVESINQLTEALAIVQGFQGGSVRQGEYLLTSAITYGVYLNPALFQTLAQKDTARTLALIDMFSRREIRLVIQLALLESRV